MKHVNQFRIALSVSSRRRRILSRLTFGLVQPRTILVKIYPTGSESSAPCLSQAVADAQAAGFDQWGVMHVNRL